MNFRIASICLLFCCATLSFAQQPATPSSPKPAATNNSKVPASAAAATPASSPTAPASSAAAKEVGRPYLSEVVNKVFVKGPTQEVPAQQGVKVQKGEAVRTDLESRAEVTFSDKTVARIGAMTLVNFDVEKREWNLAAGTMLFSKPKGGKEMKISSGSTTAAITGTTGFVTTDEKGECKEFGLVEGKASVKHKDGKTFALVPGKKLVLLPGAKLSIESFDVEKMLKTSPLFTEFKGKLPGEEAIKKEVDRIKSLATNPVNNVKSRVPTTPSVPRPF